MRAEPSAISSEGSATISIVALLIGLYFFLSPVEDFLAEKVNNLLLVLAATIILFYVLELALYRTKKIDLGSPLVLVPMMLIFLCNISVFWSIRPEVSLERNFAYSTLPFLFIVFSSRRYSQQELDLIEGLILLSAVLVLILAVIYPSARTAHYARLSLTEQNDPNNLAAFMITPFVVSMRWLMRKQRVMFWAGLAGFACTTWVVIATGSRGAALAFAASMVVGGLSLFSSKQRREWFRLGLLIGVSLLVIFILAPKAAWERVVSPESYTQDLASYGSRSDIWKVIFSYVLPNIPPWGIGSGCAPVVLVDYFGLMKAVHNTYLNIIIEYGFLGLPLLGCLIFTVLRNAYRRQNWSGFMAIVAVVVIAFFLDSFPKKFFWNAIAYGCLIARIPPHYFSPRTRG